MVAASQRPKGVSGQGMNVALCLAFSDEGLKSWASRDHRNHREG